MPKGIRLDQALVEAGLCPTRSQAQSLIMAGRVKMNGLVVTKAGTPCPADALLEVDEPSRYVSRGGLKLEKALAAFDIDPSGQYCLDIGASTGGFTDCLLQHGARHVVAVDVGTNQLAWSLRQDARVTVFEKTHANALTPAHIPEIASLAVVDVSFISLKKILPGLRAFLAPTGQLVALIKPQFEYLDYCPAKGFDGVVRTPAERRQILHGVIDDLQGLLAPWQLAQLIASPIQGPKGNVEYLSLWQTAVSAWDWQGHVLSLCHDTSSETQSN